MTRPKIHQYTQKYGKLDISQQSLDWIRLMYLIDLATKFDDSPKDFPERLIRGIVDEDWLRRWDVMKHPEFWNNMMTNLRKAGDVTSWGCFQVRRTKHSFIVTSNVGRIPIKKVQFRKRTVRYRMPSRGDPGFQKVIKDTEVKESPSPGRFLEIGV